MVSDWFVTMPMAHRGLHDADTPENSLAAFKKAEEEGYAIELDVQLMADGNIAVFHDYYLDRMTTGSGAISSKNLHDLKKIHLHGSSESVPTLDKVFETIKTPIYIDVKSHGKAGKFEQRLLALIRHYNPTVAIASFNPATLVWFRENAPDITRAVISYNYRDSKFGLLTRQKLKNLKYNRQIKPHFISYELDSLPFWRVWVARKLYKIPVISWTIRTKEDLAKAKKVSDNYIFEVIRPQKEIA